MQVGRALSRSLRTNGRTDDIRSGLTISPHRRTPDGIAPAAVLHVKGAQTSAGAQALTLLVFSAGSMQPFCG
jgi:hypothetical protein